MDFDKHSQISCYTRDELIQTIGHSLERLSQAELEAIYYDLLTKDYIR